MSPPRRLHWAKRGQVFKLADHPGRPWLNSHAQAPATLVLADRVRVYFSCRPAPDAQGRYVSHTAFVDLARNDLTRVLAVNDEPVMALGARGCFDEFGVYPFSPINMGDTVRAFYGGWTRCETTPYTVAIGVAESHDGGIRFQRLGPGPLITSNTVDAFEISGPKLRRFGSRWYLGYVAGVGWHEVGGRFESIFKIKQATSTDGLNWQRTGHCVISDVLGADECQASPDVFEMDGRFHMVFCFKHGTNFRDNARGYRIGYATSDDLVNWQRHDHLCDLGVSAQGWDAQATGYPHVFEVDGQWHLLYIGNNFGRDGFGLASLVSA